jgi:hypothetical protein
MFTISQFQMSGGNLGERVGENVGVEDFAQWFPIIREAPHITPRRDPSGAGIVMSAPAVVPSLHGRLDPAGAPPAPGCRC